MACFVRKRYRSQQKQMRGITVQRMPARPGMPVKARRPALPGIGRHDRRLLERCRTACGHRRRMPTATRRSLRAGASVAASWVSQLALHRDSRSRQFRPRQALRIAAACALLGFLGAPAAGLSLDLVAGATVSAAGLSAGAGSGFVSALGSGLASGSASGLASALGSAAGSTARTALWQPDDRLDMFFCRHCSDSMPPGGTLEQ